MTKKVKSEVKDTKNDRKFRPKLGKPRSSIPSSVERDPNYEYRWVITNYQKDFDPYVRIDQFKDRGWDVVYSTERPKDERSVAPDNDTKNSERLKPVTKRTTDGYMQVLMKCHKGQRQANEQGKEALRQEALRKSLKAVNKGQHNSITQIGDDVDLSD